MSDTPAYYQITATEDLHAFCARWLATTAWQYHGNDTHLDLLYFTLLRYVLRLPHKGQGESDGRKALACLQQLVTLLSTPPASTSAAPCPTIRYDQLSESMRDWVRRRSEPGSRWYYWMRDQTVQYHRAHEWEAFEAQVAAELASGALRRVVQVPGEEQHG